MTPFRVRSSRTTIPLSLAVNSSLEETISILKLATEQTEDDERHVLRDAISKLKVTKTLLTGSRWDTYKVTITEQDFRTLTAAKEAIEDEEKEEKEKVEKVKTAVGIAKKIIGVLGI